MRLPGLAVTRIFDLVSNPAAIVLVFGFLWFIYKDKLLSFNRKSSGKGDALAPRIEVNPTAPTPVPSKEEAPVAVDPAEPKEEIAARYAVAIETVPAEDSVEPSPAAGPHARRTSPTVAFAEPLLPAPQPEVEGQPAVEGADAAAGEPAKKKKGHRGRRGGVKHRKGNKGQRENSQSQDDDIPQESVEEVVNKAKALVREPKLEPDIITVSGDGDEVSGHILKMGSLEVNEAEQLGTGSNGTIVFAGKWDGRDVAVKRMLVQFNEIASQETRLLRESDDHPNGKTSPVMKIT
jgi:serine/threonine-protein kinase/endoribonuclease IRE1